MFHDGMINCKVLKICDRALPIVCKDSGNYFVICVNGSVTTCKWNVQLLIIEIFKAKKDLNPTFMKVIIAKRDSYYGLCNVRHLQYIDKPICGTENIQDRGCLLLSPLPSFLKDCTQEK